MPSSKYNNRISSFSHVNSCLRLQSLPRCVLLSAIYCCWLDTNQAQLSCSAIRSLSWPIKMLRCLHPSDVGGKSQRFLRCGLFLDFIWEKREVQKNACDITFPTHTAAGEKGGWEKGGGGGVILMCKRGMEGKAEKMERKKNRRWERKKKKARGRDSHTRFASSLGVSSGLQGKNYCTSPRRAGVTSLTTLINGKSVIAQTGLLSAC